MHHRLQVAMGSVALLAGSKLPATRFLVRGFAQMEQQWRLDSGFSGSLSERWGRAAEAYRARSGRGDARHLRMLGVPMTLVGAGGLLLMPRFTPGWWVGAGGFVTGMALRSVAKRVDPLYASDPLAAWVGPLDDVGHAVSRRARRLLGR